ncbi:hypothetical protein LUZ60_015842 [Juncus effusus]|nr:hypothetical protein LUZ60_015842 [Juncus effusus]
MAATQNPPRTLNVQKLAESRGPELDSLHSVVSDRLSGDFRQRRSDRRRTNSHLRRARSKRRRGSSAAGDDAAGEEKGAKKVCRRERRRRELTSNLELGFSVAGDGCRRLRTHVWHAKRFKMVKRWGFYLPLGIQGRGRGSKSVMKWLQNGALVHDASYYFAIQLEGPKESILSVLRTVLRPIPHEESELSSEKYRNILEGSRCENAMLYHVGSSSTQLVTPVTYMWRHVRSETDVCVSSANPIRQLWIWIHTAAFNEAFNVLKSACEEQQVSCFSQDGRIACLEITGVKSSQIIHQLLHPISTSDGNTNTDSYLVPCTKSLSHKTLTIDQLDKIPHGTILPLTVKDPRQVSMESDAITEDLILDSLDNKYDHKVLWDPCVKIDPPMLDNVLCEEKNKKRLSSLFLERTNENSPPGQQKDGGFSRAGPVVLVKHTNDDSMCLRWSIILPLSWVKPFWHCMISSGAHAIGLRERRWVAWKNKMPHFPYDFPDTKAYKTFFADKSTSQDASSQRRPFSIRPSKIPIPPPWNCIVQSSLHMETNPKLSGFDLWVPRSVGDLKEGVEKMDLEGGKEKGEVCVVRVLIRAFKEGLFEDGAVVCTPSLDDLSAWNFRSGNKAEDYEEKWQLHLSESSVESYFTRLESGEWIVPVPEDSKALESFRRPIGFITTGFVHACNERVAMGFCDIKILANLRRQQFIQTQIKRPEIFVLVRNMRSGAYRRAVATIVLEQQKDDLQFM